MKTTAKIIARELTAGIFDKTCSADERTVLRKFVHTNKELESKYKDFGTANGWTEVPCEVDRCNELKHFVTKKGIGRCLTEISCDICRYRYKIDSSD